MICFIAQNADLKVNGLFVGPGLR